MPDSTEQNVLKCIRQECTDVYNRLHSIAEDSAFVSHVLQAYPTFRVYPNLRCGAWYVDPKFTQAEPVYFKSTDGHSGQWAFNLRRLNHHLLKAMAHCDGIILVDSTRRGKRLPDALSKTIPIWCSVINLAAAKASKADDSRHNMETTLFTPPGAVSQSEHTQIESHLDAWATELLLSEFSIPSLPRPLRPIWITPSTETLPALDTIDFFPVVCLSASKLVPDGVGRRSAGFVYVQGSGDDHESWSQGLTPQVYWQNQAQILSSTRPHLQDLIASLVVSSAREQKTDTGPIPVARVNGRISVGRVPAMASGLDVESNAFVVITPQSFPLSSFRGSPASILLLESPVGKKGQHKLLTDVLPRSLQFITHQLQSGKNVAILCNDGKDVSVGVAVAALSINFDDQGNFTAHSKTSTSMTKQSVHKRLQWILVENTQANPSRATLKRVNEFLLSPPRPL